MLALCPEAVDMGHLTADTWYTRDAAGASTELGMKGRDLILADMRNVLGRSRRSPG